MPMETMRHYFLGLSIVLICADPLAAQEPARGMRWCAAMVCEEEAVLSVALDSVIREEMVGRDPASEPPRILGPLLPNPFRVGVRTIVDPNASRHRWVFIRRLHPRVEVLDSVNTAFHRDGVLRDGGPFFVVAPISWRGDSSAVAQIAVLPAPRQHRHERYVRLRYLDGEWRVVRIETGWIE
jgi:hypothetical protein